MRKDAAPRPPESSQGDAPGCDAEGGCLGGRAGAYLLQKQQAFALGGRSRVNSLPRPLTILRPQTVVEASRSVWQVAEPKPVYTTT